MSQATRALHLLAATSFAVGQPLLDLGGQYPAFLLAHKLEGGSLWLAVVVLMAVPPLALWGAGFALSKVHTGLAFFWHLLALGTLGLSFWLPMTKRSSLDDRWALGGAVFLSVLGIVCLLRWQASRRYLAYLAPLSIVFPMVFLATWPVRWLAFPRDLASTNVEPASNPVPVVLVVFDELSGTSLLDREGLGVDADRFPNFAALASESRWFSRATTVADGTAFSVPAILTGRYPVGQRLAKAEFYPENLFTLLGGDYSLNVSEALTQLCPEQLCGATELTGHWRSATRSLIQDAMILWLHLVMPNELAQKHLPPVDDHWYRFGRQAYDQDQAERFANFLDGLRSDENPSLHYVHSMLPHYPWIYLPSGSQYRGAERLLGVTRGRWNDVPSLRLLGVQRYLLQLEYVDSLLGQLVERLKSAGIYDQALVVVTADHGLTFAAGAHRRAVSEGTLSDIARVPLFIKLPDQESGVRDDRLVATIDLLPTIAGVLQLEVPWAMDGRDLLANDYAERGEIIVFRSARNLGRRFEFPGDLLAANPGKREPLIEEFGPGPEGLFQFGLCESLCGLEMSEVPQVSGASVEIETSPEFRRRAAIERVAVWVDGTVSSRTTGPKAIAIGVDGRVVAVVQSYETEEKRGRFAAILPESVLGEEDIFVEAAVVDTRVLDRENPLGGVDK